MLISVFLLVSMYTGAALIMISSCALLGAEFLMLKDDLAHVKPFNNNGIGDVDEDNDNNVEFTIEEFVKRHQKLLR